MSEVSRVFEDTVAVRKQTPLMIGDVGPSSSGKTYSALRLATGIQRVSGGDIYVIDTEANRALHYADSFKFRHVPFKAPFNSMDYLAAIQHCYKKGGKIIIVDSTSHEHEGIGGHLQTHEAEIERLSGGNKEKMERVKFLAWVKPKKERSDLINAILQMEANFIFCFRAKEKIKPVTGGQPKELGWQPIGGEEWIYEMTINFMLPPASRGIPKWNSEHNAERAMMKCPKQFEELFKTERSLDEAHGEAMARWAAGDSKPQAKVESLPHPQSEDGEKELVLDIIFKDLTKHYKDKKDRAEVVKKYFGVMSWDAVKSMPVKMLSTCYKKMTDERQPTEAA